MNNWKKILNELSYRVSSGIPDLTNEQHLLKLWDILKEEKWPINARVELLKNLQELDFSNKQDLATYASKHKIRPTTKVNVGGKETTAGEELPDLKDKDDVEVSKNRTKDHETTDKALNRKTTDPSEEGVGAGTNESRAGEAATHKALRMLKDGKSYDEIENYLNDIASQEDTFLQSSWVKASLSATKSIADTFGLDNIKEIAWDTPSGKKVIGAENHGTSSDMFIKLKDGERVGISLKKDGRVFIRNGGYKQTTEQMYSDLKDYGVSKDAVDSFKEKTNIENYKSDLSKSLVEAAKVMKDSVVVKDLIKKVKSDKDYAKKLGLTDKYLNSFNEKFFDNLIKKEGKVSSRDVKLIARLANSPEMMKENPEAYNNMRDADVRNTQRFLKAIKDDEQIESAIKQDVLKGIHIDQILGLDKDMNLDTFVTIYGTTPEPSQLNEKSIISMFGGEVEQLVAQHRENPTEESKSQLNDIIKSQIEIDYKDGAKDGVIKIKHEGPPPQEYPLFTIKSRARGIGASPTLEMAQTTFMANSLKFGLDVKKWPSAQRKSFQRSLEQ